MATRKATIKLNGTPIVKQKTFCPNPIAKYGIPDYADSKSNPKVRGTAAWREFWDEQFYRCVNGYITGGMWIPGRYYYYLNFFPISTVGRGFHLPAYVDFDYEFFMLVEQAKKDGYGLICVKARRKGLSFKGSCILDHGMRFTQSDYRAGIAASLEDYAKSFYRKYKRAEAEVYPEMRLNKIKSTQDETIAGFNVKYPTGYVEMGSGNTLFVRTMFADANVFKGEQLNDCIFEEAGENEKLESCYGATRSCFAVGDDMIGTPYIYGTGDKMKKSKDFKKMWYEADSHKLYRFWASRRKIYAPAYDGFINPRTGEETPDTPYLEAKYPESYMRVGMQDERRAEELFQKDIKKLLSIGDRKKYVEWVQNNPGDIMEAFQTVVENNYDISILTEVQETLFKGLKGYKAYVLDYVRDSEGVPVQPRQVFARYAQTDPRIKSNYDAPWKWVLIKDDEHPDKLWRRLYVGGLDGYNQDQSSVSDSLGAMEVYKCKPTTGETDGDYPVCVYYNRPPRKELFFEICLKIAYYYNIIEDVLCDAGSDHVIDYFRNNGGTKFLAKRPKEFASENSEQKHEFGMKFVGPAREMGEGLVQTDILDNSRKWVFPMLVQDCMGYNSEDGEKNDKDLHDAHLLALVRKAVRNTRPVNKSVKKSKKRRMNEAYYDEDGDLRFKSVSEEYEEEPDQIDALIKELNAPKQRWSGDGFEN